MNVSSTYLSHIDGFSDVDPNTISSKYSMYLLANTGDNSECKYCNCYIRKLRSSHAESTCSQLIIEVMQR